MVLYKNEKKGKKKTWQGAVISLRGRVDLPICYLGAVQFRTGFGIVGPGPGGFPSRYRVPVFGLRWLLKAWKLRTSQ